MDRKDFIRTCGFACIGGTAIGALLQSCTASKILDRKILDDNIIMFLKDFEIKGRGEKDFKNYVVIRNEILKYPICVFRLHESEYSAIWMQCTHQGAELQVFGDKLQCPAHGSEFDNKGSIKSGPADFSLRSFPVTIEKDQLKISLKAV